MHKEHPRSTSWNPLQESTLIWPHEGSKVSKTYIRSQVYHFGRKWSGRGDAHVLFLTSYLQSGKSDFQPINNKEGRHFCCWKLFNQQLSLDHWFRTWNILEWLECMNLHFFILFPLTEIMSTQLHPKPQNPPKDSASPDTESTSRSDEQRASDSMRETHSAMSFQPQHRSPRRPLAKVTKQPSTANKNTHSKKNQKTQTILTLSLSQPRLRQGMSQVITSDANLVALRRLEPRKHARASSCCHPCFSSRQFKICCSYKSHHPESSASIIC